MPKPIPQTSPTPNASDQQLRQRFEQLLNTLQQQAEAQGQESATISVQAGRPIIYRGVPGQEPASKDIPIETIQKVLAAVEDPKASNGTVKLSVNGGKPRYVQNGT